MINITVNSEELEQALKQLQQRVHDLAPVMRAISETLKTETEFNFEEEGRPAWLPSLAARKREGMTLSDSGHLRKSITTQYDERHALIGTNLKYARIHQLGGKAGRRQSVLLPARPYLPVTPGGELQDGVEKKIIQTIEQYLKSAVR